MVSSLRVSADGAEVVRLIERLADGPHARPRRLLGLVGEPGAGKSLLAAALARHVGQSWAVVPMDGFHLADDELRRQGLLDRKGAPETFDAWGYAALLERLRGAPSHTVYAPAFERDLEQPLAGAIGIAPTVTVVVTEGNYLLLDRPEWCGARAALDTVWFVEAQDELRLERLVRRHIASGKSPEAAREWVDRVDGPNAALVRGSRERADLVLDLTAWSGRLSSA